MLTSRRPASFGMPVEPEVNNLSAARGVSPPSGWRDGFQLLPNDAPARRRRVAGGLDDAVERRRLERGEQRRRRDHGRSAGGPAADQRGRELEAIAQIERPPLAVETPQARLHAGRRCAELAPTPLGAVAPERDDVVGRVREQLTQAARRHEVNLRFTTERIASSTANTAPIKRYAIKPL